MAKFVRLDGKDKKILLELDTDATQSLGQIARKLRTTKEVVAYRIKQLKERRIITNYITLSHFAKLDLTHYKLYIEYTHITAEKKREIIDYVLRQKDLGWLASTEGTFDLMIAVRFPSVFEFERFKDDFFSKFDSFFQRNSFAIMTEAETYPRQYIMSTKNPMRKVFVLLSPAKKENLDSDDIKIIKALSKNSRASSVEIARMTGLTERIIRYRRQVLERKGVIVGYKLAINYRNLNYLFFKCLIKSQHADEKRLHEFKLYARQHPNVVHWLKVIGEWDIEIEIEMPSLEEFYKMSNEIREKFSDIIQTFDAVLVSEEHAVTHA
ncbi:MAG: Lrp/AsnC family transcriptional regulator [Candidatus Aenigmarchaeota archaeon]|nr:Lrp/AsnC family transcriptional regulator [Candidatus Aenigmarchaeota archaeon]MDI6722301.1 Lrp/AsnC family transcriptional regulator [Candidatus Aenigmarchaeota archaeon]